MKKLIYLDYAAATPLNPTVLAAMKPYFSKSFHNPSAIYLTAKNVKNDLEVARAKIAGSLGSRPGEVIFTAGATEANNLAIQGVMNKFPKAELLVSAVEHESVLAPASLFKHHKIPVDRGGIIELKALEGLIKANTVLISIMAVNNEVGSLQPLGEVGSLIKKIRVERAKVNNSLPLYLHSDAAAAGNFLDLKVNRLRVDLMTINGSKLYGPKQSGALFVKAGTVLQPLILGGGQEFGIRSGTENVAGCIGLATAFEMAQNRHVKEAKRLLEIKHFFATKLQKTLPSSVINGSLKHSAPHILSIVFPGVDNEILMMQLDEAGVQVATGSACSANSNQPSHVLSAMGLSDQEAQNSLRFSLGRQTSRRDIKRTIKLLTDFINSKK